jgi:hypothetical protein
MLPVSHHRKTAMARFFQLNIKRAAMAQTWNANMKNVVVQFRGC